MPKPSTDRVRRFRERRRDLAHLDLYVPKDMAAPLRELVMAIVRLRETGALVEYVPMYRNVQSGRLHMLRL